MSFIQTFGADPIQPASVSYILVNLTSNKTLSWPIQFQNTNLTAANYINVIPTNNGFTLTLPDAEDVSVGQAIIINNPSAYTFTLNKFDNTLLYTFTPGTTRYIILTDNTTTGGTWNNHPFVAGGSNVTSIAASSSSNNLVITGSPITSAGTFTFDFDKDLYALSNFGVSTGIACRTATDTWNLRSVVGTANQVAVANPKGILGDITLSLATNLSGITSLRAGDITLSTNTITTATLNQDLILDPNGTGLVRISGGGLRIDAGSPLFFYATDEVHYVSFQAGNMAANYALTWPTTAPAANQVLQHVAGNELGWVNVTTFGGSSSVNAITRFADTIGSLTNSTVFLDSSGNITSATSVAVANLLLGGVGASVPNTIASTNVDGNILLSPNGTGESVSTGNFSIRANKTLKLYELAGASNYLSFKSPTSLTNIINYTFPGETPKFGQVMVTSVEGTSPTLAMGYLTSAPNLLVNGGFDVWQRAVLFDSTTFVKNNDNTYCADGWKLLSDGNDIVSVARIASPSAAIVNTSKYCWNFVCTTGGAKFGMCQILESSRTIPLQNQNVAISFSALGVGTTNLKVAILGWTGAADAPTSDPVSVWNVTDTPPTLAVNWSYLYTATYTLTGNLNTSYNSTPIAIGGTVTNLAVFIWCDSTTGVAGNNISIGAINLTKGVYFTPYYPKSPEAELLDCKRIFQKDLPYDTTVGTSAVTTSTRGTVVVSPIGAAATVANNASYAAIEYEVEMTDAKAITVTTYPVTTTTNTNRVSDNTGTDLAANSGTAVSSDRKGFVLKNTAGAGINTTGYLLFHYMADAGF